MAYMERNDLRFDRADDNGDAAYNMIYTLMVKYYLDLRAMQEASKESHDELVDMTVHERNATDLKLGSSTSGKRGDLWGKKLDVIEQMMQAEADTSKPKRGESRLLGR